MILSHISYLIILGGFFVLILLLSFFMEKRKVMKFPGIFVIIAFILIIFINQKCPFIYTITDCGEYKKEILIGSKTLNGVEITWGNKAWINNESPYYLYVEAIVYGHSNKNPRDQEIEPHQCIQAEAYKIDYIFEEPPRTIRIKQNSAVRYWLDCQYEYDNETDSE